MKRTLFRLQCGKLIESLEAVPVADGNGGARNKTGDNTGNNTLQLHRADGSRFDLQIVGRDHDTLVLMLNGVRRRVRYVRRGRHMYMSLDGRQAVVEWLEDHDQDSRGQGSSDPVVRAPMPGKVLEVLVATGDSVAEGDPLVRVEAMKMEVDLTAEFAGTVDSVHVSAGDLVDPDAALVTLAPLEKAPG